MDLLSSDHDDKLDFSSVDVSSSSVDKSSGDIGSSSTPLSEQSSRVNSILSFDRQRRMEEETNSGEDWLFTLLKEEELLQYYDKIKDDLQIKRLAVSS